eukprot:CAMPEP_0181198588 /NCGR_PEP_ID=MMETSP1096-20121128/16706_1 /TAXON_ID=156174 ORGANISM="Chrysochromulina ericina, Strain CCMP281" /NCGR_SAMPLE_ID=MMETSP1096 /ASSEMBLY_ACC=CAM_ASM_000453 /LENGTH=129 /DNA_ID=CAMNT_0023288679 /DNA_START=179 /DNA_END=568 /DNA_ORIENTATION=+
MPVFKRFVEVGRVVLISYGPDAGKLATIVDVMDHNRVLVDGPEKLTGVHRHEINVKRIKLTDMKVGAKLNASHKQLERLWKDEAVLATYEATAIAKKRKGQAARAKATDFERFQVQLARKERSAARKAA